MLILPFAVTPPHHSVAAVATQSRGWFGKKNPPPPGSIWARLSAQHTGGYFQQGYPPIPSDPNFTPTVTSTYSTTSRTTLAMAFTLHEQLSWLSISENELGDLRDSRQQGL